MADLGDLSDFMKDAAISNLDWLDVDEAEYRKTETLPKQNLDVVPDLEAAWMHKDEPVGIYAVPNKQPVPSFQGAGDLHTMGDMSQAHGRLRAKPEDVRKTARLALMQSPDLNRLRTALTSRYDRDTLNVSRDVISSVLAERGLLGKLYIDSVDFPTCDTGITGAAKATGFVGRYAKEAKYVLAKPRCAGCVHSMKSPIGVDTCSVFHKEITVEVPYTEALAVEVESLQQAKGKNIAVTASTPRERIRLANLADNFLAPGPSPMPKPKDNVARLMKPLEVHEPYRAPVNLTPIKEAANAAVRQALGTGRITLPQAKQAFDAISLGTEEHPLLVIKAKAEGLEPPAPRVYQGSGEAPEREFVTQTAMDEGIISAANLTKKRDQEARNFLAAKKAKPVLALMQREMLKGRGITEVIDTMKVAFSGDVLNETRPLWEPLFHEAGLYGTIYSAQESFNDCAEGHDFIAKQNPTIRAIVAGAKCSSCIYNKVSRCLIYGKPLVKDASVLYTPETVNAVLLEGRTSGKLSQEVRLASEFGATPRDQLKAIHRASSRATPIQQQMSRLDHVKAYHGMSQETPREVVNPVVASVRRLLNEGLYGKDLLTAIKLRFQPSVIAAAQNELRAVIAEQGLQGIFYVDPAAYDDYGYGCKEAERLHRSRLVEYAKVGSKCQGCVHQTKQGYCSTLDKALVDEPPYYDKAAQQRDILASGTATEIRFENLINNGQSMMVEYEMQNRLAVEIDPEVKVASLDVQLGKVAKTNSR